MRVSKLVVGVLLSILCMGAGSVTVLHGMVRTIKGSDMVVMLKNGSERTVKLSKDTRVFLSGDLSPYRLIKPNSKVEVAVNSDGKCLQVVVQEGPK